LRNAGRCESRTTNILPWDVRHLSLNETLPDLAAKPGVGGLFVVFWCGDIPLGQLAIPAGLLPIPSSQLAVTAARTVAEAVGDRVLRNRLAQPESGPAGEPTTESVANLARMGALQQPLRTLTQLESSVERGGTDSSVSIVICTRNRPESLDRCLQSIRALSPAATEIVIIDRDPASGLTRPVIARFPDVRYLAEPRRGLSIARNSGILNCTGSIIAFTDDEVVVHPRWISAIRAAFHEADVMALTGLVLPGSLATPAQQVMQADTLSRVWGYRAADFDARFFVSMRHVEAPAWRLNAGANMAFRRKAFDLVGLFDERLGAGAAGSGEGSDLWYRLLAQGYRCHYSPSAVIFCQHRSDWTDLRAQLRRYMRGHVAALLFQFDRHRHWGHFPGALLVLAMYFVTIAIVWSKRQLGRWVYDPATDVLSAPVVPQAAGALAGFGYYLRHRRSGGGSAIPNSVRQSTQVP
jgi:GT2 family glycosyltransferase